MITQINNKNLIPITGEDLKVGDVILCKGKRITSFGRKLEVIRNTKKQVVTKCIGIWFPIFDNTAFGRIAKGESIDKETFNEINNTQIDKEVRFWKHLGCGVGTFKDLSLVKNI